MTLSLALLAASVAMTPGLPGEPRAQRDHVLVITIDDLNDWVGCLSDPLPPAPAGKHLRGRGHPQARTPNLDRLAGRGVLFTNAHCQAPICIPSRTSFLSGLRPSTTGVYGNRGKHNAEGRLIPGQDVPLLPDRFEAAGYTTYSAGKVQHRGPVGEIQAFSTGQGPFPEQKLSIPASVTPKGVWDFGPYPDLESHTDWRIAQWTIEHIRRPVASGEAPRFFTLGFYRPHVPLFAPARWFDEAPAREEVLLHADLPGDLDDLPEIARRTGKRMAFPQAALWVRSEEARLRDLTRAYLAVTSAMDHCLGQVIDALDGSAMANDTWIVVLSDHGWHLGEKDHVAKQTLWSRSTHVPLIIVPPRRMGDTPRGVRCDRPAELLDVYPTLLAAAGVPPIEADAGLEGLSLLPWVRDPEAPRERPALTTLYCGNNSLCDDRYRYTRYADGEEELYDRLADPHEFFNLIPARHGRPELDAVVERLSGWIPDDPVGEPDEMLAGDEGR